MLPPKNAQQQQQQHQEQQQHKKEYRLLSFMRSTDQVWITNWNVCSSVHKFDLHLLVTFLHDIEE